MLFRKIIRELQQCEYGYEDYIASLFNIILLLVSRQQQESEKTTTSIPEEIEAAVAYFNENYNTKVSVDDYAESLHISTNWFIRNFKLKNEKNSLTTRSCRNCGRKHTNTICPFASDATVGWVLA